LAEPYFKDINDFIKEIAQLAAITKGNLSCIRLLGGEPLLHPQLSEFAFITRKAFPNSFIEIVTNGILLPQQKQDFFNLINQYNISIYLSDYNLSPKIKECLQNKVLYYRIGEKDTFIKPALNLHGSNQEENFKKCYQIFQESCVNLRDGYLYHCPTEAYFDFFTQYFNIELKNFDLKSNGINIFESTLEDIESYINTESNFCKYCSIQDKMVDYDFCLSQKKMSEWLA
jgi:MoaA/NifB/PqqE/SkfB family radical SAM enzyme